MALRTSAVGTRVLDFFDSDRAKKRWGHWKFVRFVVAWSIWAVRYLRHPAVLSLKSSHSAKSVH